MPSAKSRSATAASSTSAAPEPNLKRAFQLVMEMMAIPGTSGQETAVAEYVRQRLVAAGVPAASIKQDTAHKRTPLKGACGNLICKLPGTIKGPRRLLMAHLDTVPICVGSQPKRDGEFVRSANPATGLGADDRAGAAAVLCAALEIIERGLPHPPLTFFWPVQEEVGLYGARYVDLPLLGKPELSFNFDGGATEKATNAATGAHRMQIDIAGIASHAGAAPEHGVSAITIAALAIADLSRNGWHGDIRKGKKRGTSNVGIIRGGDATNVITPHVMLKAEARSHDPAFCDRIAKEIHKAFQRAVKEVKNVKGQRGSVKIESAMQYVSFRMPEDEPCVLAAMEAIKNIGREPRLATSNGGLDANWMVQHSIPTVTLGCGQAQIHTVNEKLDIKQFESACRIALRLATGTESLV